MKLINLKSGQTEVVADPTSAILNRTHEVDPASVVRYLNPEDGQTYETTGSEIFDRLSKGAVLESTAMAKQREMAEKYGDQTALAATLGAGRGLSFGLTDAAANALGYGEQVAEIKRQNEAASTIGEIGGVLVPMIFSGGTSLIGQGARVATTGTRAVSTGARKIAEEIVENQIGQRILGSAIEGAAYGAGKSISETSLGEPAHLAENILIGAGFGGALQLGVEGAKALAGKGRRLISGIIDFTSQRTQDSAPFLANNEEGRAVRELISKGPKGVEELQKAATDIARENLQLGKDSAALFKSTKLAKASEFLAGKELGVADVAAQRIQKAGLDLVEELKASPDLFSQPMRADLESAMNGLGKRLQNAKDPAAIFNELDEVKRVLRDAGKVPRSADRAAINTSKKIGDLEALVRDSLENVDTWGEAATMQQRLNTARHDFFLKEKEFKTEFMKKVGDNWEIDPRKVSSMIKNPDAPANELKIRVFQDYVENSNKLRDALATYGAPTLEGKAAQEVLLHDMRQLLSSGKNLRDFADLGGGLSIPLGGGRVGLSIGPSAQSIVRGLGWMERTSAKLNNSWVKDVGDAMAALSTPMASKISLAASDVIRDKEDVERFADLTANPAAISEVAAMSTSEIAQFAPQTAEAMSQKIAESLSFLSEFVPRPPAQDLLGGRNDWEPSASETSRFQRYVTAASDPSVLLKEIKSGMISPETVLTVKTLYPNFFEKTVGAVRQYIAEKGPKVPYERRVGLSTLFETGLVEALKPQSMLLLQSTYAPTESRGPGRPPGAKNVNVNAQSYATQGQRLQSEH